MLPRLALLLCSVALILGFGELFARVSWREPPPRRAVDPRVRDSTLPELGLGDLAHPNVEGRHGGMYFRTNSMGIRAPEYEIDPPPGVFRIAITGDSVTVGVGVSEEEAYPRLLEDLLNARRDGRRYEALNVALWAINGPQAIDRLIRIGEYYAPHLAVYGFTINDLEGWSFEKLSSDEYSAVLREARPAAASYVPRRSMKVASLSAGASSASGSSSRASSERSVRLPLPSLWRSTTLPASRVDQTARHRPPRARSRSALSHLVDTEMKSKLCRSARW